MVIARGPSLSKMYCIARTLRKLIAIQMVRKISWLFIEI
jgi:hypothetical protein